MIKKYFYVLVIVLLSLFAILANAFALDVVPGLKGYGTDTRAAYGNGQNPTIYIVNTLNPNTALQDSTRNGVAVKTGGWDTIMESTSPNKMILFEVSGYIVMNSEDYYEANYVTVAGQTAPSPGITIRNSRITIGGDHWLVQHIRIRMDDCEAGAPYSYRDALNVNSFSGNYASNVVIDHVSMSWAMDENSGIGHSFTGNSNITMANSIMSEGLSYSYHPSGEHSKGQLFGGGNDIFVVDSIIAHCRERSPAVNPTRIDLVWANNVVYNSGLPYVEANQNADTNLNFIGNFIKGGPNFQGSTLKHPDYFLATLTTTIDVYIADTRFENYAGTVYTQTSSSDWSRVGFHSSIPQEDRDAIKNTSPTIPLPSGWTPRSSADVEDYVLANAGARPADRDSADIRIISDISNKTGAIIDSPSDVGWPTLAQNTRNVATIGFPANPHGDDDYDGYTNLEEWLHGLAAVVEGVVEEEPATRGVRIE